MKTRAFPLSLALALLLPAAACRPSKADVERMAAGACDCMRPLAESLAAAGRSAAGTPEDFEAFMESVEAAADAADDCMETLESNYGDELSDRETEIREAMQRRCPEVTEAMEAAETGFPLEPGG